MYMFLMNMKNVCTAISNCFACNNIENDLYVQFEKKKFFVWIASQRADAQDLGIE